jgi:predicted RecB family endonuclease
LAKANYTLNPLASLYAGAHDLHEVYVADIVSGMKPHLTNYRRIEYSWEVYVHESLGLPWSLRPHEEVKYVDMRALVLEMNVLRHPSAKEVASQLGGEPSGEELQIMMDVRALSVSDCWDLLWAEICQGIQYIKEVRNGKGKSNSQERESRSS